MNEHQRQAYISALGIDSYMPRWHLLQAPLPVACALPVLPNYSIADTRATISFTAKEPAPTPVDVSSLLADMALLKKPITPAVLESSIPSAPLNTSSERIAVAPFSLSIWRPLPGFLVLDVRKTNLALPTELFLSQILRACFGGEAQPLDEEVLRWPMVENRFVSTTQDDARAELQTWLTVEHELRPISRLWLMGYNAAAFLVPHGTSLDEALFRPVTSAVANLPALYTPNLSELLQRPLLKATLWKALRDVLQC